MSAHDDAQIAGIAREVLIHRHGNDEHAHLGRVRTVERRARLCSPRAGDASVQSEFHWMPNDVLEARSVFPRARVCPAAAASAVMP